MLYRSFFLMYVVADFSCDSAMHNANVSPEAQKEAERKLNAM